jgi:hypothetical protein
MTNHPEPVVLDLAPLPREKIGPFLILGVSKEAAREQIEASWARRLIAARKNQLSVSLEDINWAKETIYDPERRVKADATSLNTDLLDGVLRRIVRKYSNVQGGPRPSWPPADLEKPLQPLGGVDVPDWQQLRDSIVVPNIPDDIPAIPSLLAKFTSAPLDPWNIEGLPPSSPATTEDTGS